MNAPLRIALAGPGGIADRFLAPALARTEGACLWSVLSRDRERALAFARKHGALAPQPAFTDAAELLRDPALDAVLIATPDALHAELALHAAAAGKHVLCEKPLATSSQDAWRMAASFRAHQRVLAVAYHLRWHAGHRALRERVVQGALGSLRHLRVQWSWQAPDAGNWRASDPAAGRWWALAAMGTHALDLVRWMMLPHAGEVTVVNALTSDGVWRSGHDETAVVALRFASGATAEVCVSTVFRSAPRVELYGSAGSALCDGTLGPHGAGTIALDGAPLEFAVSDPYAGELADFVRAVREGGEPEVSGEEGARNVGLLERASG